MQESSGLRANLAGMTPEDKQRIYEEEKVRDQARRKIAYERKYGGVGGKFFLNLSLMGATLQIILGLIGLAVIGWCVWAVTHH